MFVKIDPAEAQTLVTMENLYNDLMTAAETLLIVQKQVLNKSARNNGRKAQNPAVLR